MKGFSSHVVSIFFNDRKEVLNLVDTGGDVISYLTQDNIVCPLIGTEIVPIKILGQGATGVVFEIDFENRGAQRYAAKKTETDWTVEESLNLCTNKEKFERTDKKGYITIPKGSLICEPVFTEYIISLLVGELYRRGISINFIDTFHFALCRKISRKIRGAYTFMQVVDDTVKTYKNPTETIVDGIYIQILHSIAVLQQNHRIVHEDLHYGNIFLKFLEPGMEWNGENLSDADFYEFKLGNESFYASKEVPIVKIGDWGQSVKFGDIIIGDKETISTGYDQYDGKELTHINFFNKSFDIVFCTVTLHDKFPNNKLITQTLAWMLDLEPGYSKVEFTDSMHTKISLATRRPKLSKLDAFEKVSPEATLQTISKFTSAYSIRPKGRGIVLGVASI